MAWLIGIIVLILCVVFWRASLILIGIGGVLVFLLVQNQNSQQEQRDRERAAAAERTRTLIAAARLRVEDARQTVEPKDWRVITETDPASGQAVPRQAAIESDDGLCTMTVEERIDRTRLTSFRCPGLNIRANTNYTAGNVEVKFDNRSTADSMDIRGFSRGAASAYIPSAQATYSNRLGYDDFLRRLGSANKVAIQLDFNYVGKHWITFSLDSSRAALTAIGAL